MKLSTRGHYGTQLLLDLAMHQTGAPVLLRDIARRQQISLPYLKRLVGPLVAGGLVRSNRGVRGGVSLARPPELIRLSEVFRLLEGPISLLDCVEDNAVCGRSASCAPRDVWCEMVKAMSDVLESRSLADLLKLQQSKDTAPTAAAYQI